MLKIDLLSDNYVKTVDYPAKNLIKYFYLANINKKQIDFANRIPFVLQFIKPLFVKIKKKSPDSSNIEYFTEKYKALLYQIINDKPEEMILDLEKKQIQIKMRKNSKLTKILRQTIGKIENKSTITEDQGDIVTINTSYIEGNIRNALKLCTMKIPNSVNNNDQETKSTEEIYKKAKKQSSETFTEGNRSGFIALATYIPITIIICVTAIVAITTGLTLLPLSIGGTFLFFALLVNIHNTHKALTIKTDEEINNDIVTIQKEIHTDVEKNKSYSDPMNQEKHIKTKKANLTKNNISKRNTILKDPQIYHESDKDHNRKY